MQLPWMSTRQWIIWVAVVALMFGYGRSSFQMWALAHYHHQQQARPLSPLTESSHRYHVQRHWHAKMEEKYRRAVWRPWISIEPEPLPR
jgi:hypothetical protein